MKYFAKYQLGKNNEKLWAAILKVFLGKNARPRRFYNNLLQDANIDYNKSK